MDNKTIFAVTLKGDGEIKNHTRLLSDDVRRALVLIDDESTVEELTRRAAPDLRAMLDEVLQELLNGGFIRDKAKAESMARIAAPKISTPVKKVEAAGGQLDFTDMMRAPTPQAEINVRTKAEAEAAHPKSGQKAKSEAERQARQAAKVKMDAAAARSMIATVLFFDVEGYTKQSVSKQIELKAQFNKLVSEFIKDIDESQRIILDTGDGAAIGFLQHPEDAIEVAMQFQHAVTANKHRDYPELKVRMGIHLGPVTVVKDMNGQNNMVGDGINDAQRIMSFAQPDHIYISRAYYDVVSRLSAEYAGLLLYRGVENDKHGRQHHLYEVVDRQTGKVEEPAEQQEFTSFPILLEPFALNSVGKATADVATQFPGAAPSGDARIGDAATTQKLAEVAPPKASPPALPAQPEKIAQKSQKETEAEAKTAAEQKAQQKAEAARIEAEREAARIRDEEEMRVMAEEQAKAWADAEQRARDEAEAEAQAEAQARVGRAAQPPQAQPVLYAAKTRRDPLPWGKIISSLVILLLVLAAALPYVWPMQGFVAQIEKKLSAQLQQPVHIAHMKAALLPSPKLELQDVAVGGAQELRAGNVVLNFNMATLLGDAKAITSMEMGDVALSAESFGETLSWLRAAGGDAHYPVAHMVLRRARVSGAGLDLPSVNGSADLDAQGHFTKAVLNSEDGKFNVEVQPHQSRWQLALNIKESSLPLLPGILFDELVVKGEVGDGIASFNEIGGRLYGGSLTGSAHLTWQKGWQMQGRVSVKTLELHDALPQAGISGAMRGDISFVLNGAKLPQLADAPRMDGSFVVKDGVISKVDMVETARSTNLQSMPGGRTHFEELSGTLQVENNNKHFRQVKISGGVMSANGSADVSPNKQLSGRLMVDLRILSKLERVPLVLSGTIVEPVLRSGR